MFENEIRTLLDTPYLNVRAQHQDGSVFLHATIHKWSHSLYKAYLFILEDILEALKNDGFKEVFVLIPPNDAKLKKFECMFGFTEVMQTQDYLLMRREIT